MSVLIAFYLGMSVALTASYYARTWDEAGQDEAKQKSAIRKAIFFPYFILAMPVIVFPAVKRRLQAYHAVIFDEEELVEEEGEEMPLEVQEEIRESIKRNFPELARRNDELEK